jgi:hypothetical protein
MWLADKSSVHNCGRNILSSIFDLRQFNNIKHWGRFAHRILLRGSGTGFSLSGFEFYGRFKNQNQTG